MSNIVPFDPNTKKAGLVRLRQNDLEALERASTDWMVFWQGCAAGSHRYSLSRIAAYIGLHRNHPQFCLMVQHCAPEWLAHLGWDGEDEIGPHLLNMFLIELGAYDYLTERLCKEFDEITCAELRVMNLAQEETVRDAGAMSWYHFGVMASWCDRRANEVKGET